MPMIASPAFPPPTAMAAFPLRRIPRRQALRVLGALVFATVACVGIVVARTLKDHSGQAFQYLIWNLMLAWIPLGFAFAAYRCYDQQTRRNVLFAMCALAWFLFFPNAPYITTDIVHVHDDPDSASWFHLLSIMSFAWIGLCLGYLSLYLMQEIVRARCGRVFEWVFVVVMLGAATFGVFLGRFWRWNSWDVLWHRVGYLRWRYHEAHPFDEASKGVFSAMMFLFLLVSYAILYTLTHLHEPEQTGK